MIVKVASDKTLLTTKPAQIVLSVHLVASVLSDLEKLASAFVDLQCLSKELLLSRTEITHIAKKREFEIQEDEKQGRGNHETTSVS